MKHDKAFYEREMRIRMYHQMFLIMVYKLYVLRAEHRELTKDEAAVEWVELGEAAKFRDNEEST